MRFFLLVAASLLVLASVAQATIVDANEEWKMALGPGESFTCLVHYIPDIPTIPTGLLFEKEPEWTSTIWFDYTAEGWQTAISTDEKTAYLYGPRLTNNTSSEIDLFSFNLFYQWDTAAAGFDANYPVYQDVAVFDDQTMIHDAAWRGIPGEPWVPPDDETWLEQYDPGLGPYTNPVPEPSTICLLGLSALVFIRKRHRRRLTKIKVPI